MFDHVVYGPGASQTEEPRKEPAPLPEVAAKLLQDAALELPPAVKSVVVVQSPATPPATPETEMPPPAAIPVLEESTAPVAAVSAAVPAVTPTQRDKPTGSLGEIWEQELRSARRKLEPEGALTGATRELQAGLGAFLQICHEHGVKVGPWRLQHVVPEWTFGDHPTYGAITISHWACRDGQPWKVGIGLFLGRGPAKPRDLATKLSVLDAEPPSSTT